MLVLCSSTPDIIAVVNEWLPFFLKQKEEEKQEKSIALVARIKALEELRAMQNVGTVTYRGRLSPTHSGPAEPLPSRNGAQVGQYVRIGSENIHDLTVDATIDGRQISVFPDLGAGANFVSKLFVKRNGLKMVSTLAGSVQKANGSRVRTLGSVELPFAFRGESQTHTIAFHVLAKSIHDVILGAPFLQKTKTFTDHFVRRVRRTLRGVCSPLRVRYLQSQSYLSGWLDGERIDAIPDTGSDVTLISAAYAKRRGFKVNNSKEHRKLLEFVDGSTAWTKGVVENVDWQYNSAGSRPFKCDMYVLEGLQCDALLSFDLLDLTDAFGAHQDCLFDKDQDVDDWNLQVIREVPSWLDGLYKTKHRLFGRRVADQKPANTGSSGQLDLSPRKARESFEEALKLALGRPEAEREAYIAPFRDHYHQSLQRA